MAGISQPRLALIGCGGIAGGGGEEKGGHLLSLEKMGMRVATYCDVNLELARKRRQQFGPADANVTADPAEVFADPGIDAVIICTRHDSNAPLTVRAAKAGKHVFVEKALALSIEACQAVIDAQNRTGRKIMVGFSKRYTPAYKALMPLKGQAKLLVAQCYEPTWDSYDFWGKDPISGGGQVYMCGIHVADMMLELAGSEPVRVTATGGPVTPAGPTIINKAYALVEFANGTHGVFASSDTGDCSMLSKFSLEFHTGLGVAIAHERLKHLTVSNIPGLAPLREEDEHFDHVMRDFVRCLREDLPVPVGPAEGLRTTRLVVRIIESIRAGAAVSW